MRIRNRVSAITHQHWWYAADVTSTIASARSWILATKVIMPLLSAMHLTMLPSDNFVTTHHKKSGGNRSWLKSPLFCSHFHTDGRKWSFSYFAETHISDRVLCKTRRKIRSCFKQITIIPLRQLRQAFWTLGLKDAYRMIIPQLQ